MPHPIDVPNHVLVGGSKYVESATIQANTTVQLSESVRLGNGKVVPKGSIVTVSDDAMKVVYPDGTSELASYAKVNTSPLGLVDGAKGILTPKDFPEVAGKISQKQLRHIAGRPELEARGGGGFLNSVDDAQKVLDAYRIGQVKILGKNAQGFPVVKFEGVTGTNVNAGVGITGQPTNVFIIKGTKSPSIVPANPNWTQK